MISTKISQFSEFLTNSDDHKSVVTPKKKPITYVYTDGACIHNGKPNAKAGVGVYFGPNDPRNVSERLIGEQTNNRAELTAILKVFSIMGKEILRGDEIVIYTDSEYSKNCLTVWGRKWASLGWKVNKKNLDLIREGYQYFQKYSNVTLEHIRSHTGKQDVHSLGNEMADKLATESIGVTYRPPEALQVKKAVDKKYVITFGKYKGKTLAEINEIDRSYLKWCAKNIKNKEIVTKIKYFLSETKTE